MIKEYKKNIKKCPNCSTHWVFDDEFKVTYDDGGCSYVQFHYQCDWELVLDVPKFKVGDRIRHKKNT